MLVYLYKIFLFLPEIELLLPIIVYLHYLVGLIFLCNWWQFSIF